MRLIPGMALALIVCLRACTAAAGDIAEHRILGFSPDASVFAFEEFGVQDGSGFPYATIYFVETATDSWLEGTPIRVQLRDETASLAQARAQARQEAEPLLAENDVEDRWLTLAHSPLGEYEQSPTSLSFGLPKPWNALEDIDQRFEAELDIYYAETPGQDCVTFIGDRPTGFRLRLRQAEGAESVLHEDETIPRSRGCPITYRITRVVAPDSYPIERVVVLVSVLRFGFEGADRRFLAVAGELPQ